MDRYEHYLKLFNEELQNRRVLDNAVNIPILIITSLIAFLTYVIESLGYKNGFCALDKFEIIITVFLGIIFVLLIVATLNVIKSYNNYLKGYDYEILGSNKEFEDYRNDLFKYKNEHGDEAEFSPDKKFKEEIIKKIVFATDNNSAINIKRNYYLFLSKRSIVLSLIVSFFVFVILIISKI